MEGRGKTQEKAKSLALAHCSYADLYGALTETSVLIVLALISFLFSPKQRKQGVLQIHFLPVEQVRASVRGVGITHE